MRLHCLRVENYRALQEASLEFDDSITVLFGENDCGKSSLLNALEACLGQNAPLGGFTFLPSDFHRSAPEGLPAGRIRIEIGLREEEPPSDPERAWPVLRSSGLAGADGRLDFVLAVNATLEAAGSVRTDFGFQAPRPLEADPASLLAEVRRVVPFLRIRSGILRPAPALKTEPLPEKAARQEVEWAVRQAWSEFLEDPDRISADHLVRARGALDEVLDQLEERLVPGPQSGLERRISAPLSPSGSWRRIAGLLRGAWPSRGPSCRPGGQRPWGRIATR